MTNKKKKKIDRIDLESKVFCICSQKEIVNSVSSLPKEKEPVRRASWDEVSRTQDPEGRMGLGQGIEGREEPRSFKGNVANHEENTTYLYEDGVRSA